MVNETKRGPMHMWNEGKISGEQKVHAIAANECRAEIQERLHANFASPSPPLGHVSLIGELLGELHYQLGVSEARLWAASKPTVRVIEDFAAILLKFLQDHGPRQVGDVVDEVMGHARVVDDALRTLTNIQPHTMLTLPGVALAHDIANECRFAKELNSPITSARYQSWVEQASTASVERQR